MEERLNIFVSGIPKAQPRARVVNKGGRTWAHNPTTANDWKAQIKSAFLKYTDLNIKGGIIVNIIFLMKRPQRLLTKKSPDESIPHIIKPDKDNLEKAVLDSLSDIGLWGDDCQVYKGNIEKLYCSKNGNTGAWIEIIYNEIC
jgi:Holliday junction resolvase RusA-like endonuclease